MHADCWLRFIVGARRLYLIHVVYGSGFCITRFEYLDLITRRCIEECKDKLQALIYNQIAWVWMLSSENLHCQYSSVSNQTWRLGFDMYDEQRSCWDAANTAEVSWQADMTWAETLGCVEQRCENLLSKDARVFMHRLMYVRPLLWGQSTWLICMLLITAETLSSELVIDVSC